MSERIELPRIASWFLAAWIVAGSLALAWTTLATMATYGWEHPTQDQYRLYRHYLERPFPESILQIENQHRPIVPGLVRVAEIHLRDADQGLQLAFGTACVLLLAAGGARAAFGAQALSPATRAAGAAAGTIGLLWLGNARILLHGNEIVHVGVVGLCALLVAWCSVRAARARRVGWAWARWPRRPPPSLSGRASRCFRHC